MNQKHSVFISSTFKDLEQARTIVAAELIKDDCFPVGMNINFLPTEFEKKDYIKRMLGECDYCVLILGRKYGSLINEGEFEGKSFTEMEYIIAQRMGIPIIALVARNGAKFPVEDGSEQPQYDSDEELIKKFERFRDKVINNGGECWSDKSDLISFLKNGLKSTRERNPRAGWQRLIFEKETIDIENSPTSKSFIGFHYSFKKHSVVNFDFIIDYHKSVDQRNPMSLSNSQLIAKEFGLHERITQDGCLVYYGSGYKKGHFLYFNLIGATRKDQLNVILFIGESESLTGLNIIKGSYTGVSEVLNHIMTAEAVFVEKSFYEKMKKEEKEEIHRYLFAKRLIFRVPPRVPRTVNDLRIRKKFRTNIISNLVGVYRVWTLTRSGGLIQSKLIVENNYKTTLSTAIGHSSDHKNQTCLINFSQETGLKICISTHPWQQTSIINYAILNLPARSDFKFVMGTFCSVGVLNGGVVSGCVGLKPDMVEFEPCAKKKEDVLSFVRESNNEEFLKKIIGYTKKNSSIQGTDWKVQE